MKNELPKKIEEAIRFHQERSSKLAEALEFLRSDVCEESPATALLNEKNSLEELVQMRRRHERVANRLSDANAAIIEASKLENGETDPIHASHSNFRDCSLGDACERIVANHPRTFGFTKEEFFRRIRKGGGRITEPKVLSPILSKDPRFISASRGVWTTTTRVRELRELLNGVEQKKNGGEEAGK